MKTTSQAAFGCDVQDAMWVKGFASAVLQEMDSSMLEDNLLLISLLSNALLFVVLLFIVRLSSK